jgi:hypothetical protein
MYLVAVGGQKDLVNVFRCRRSVPHPKLRLHVMYDFQSVINITCFPRYVIKGLPRPYYSGLLRG